VVGGRPTRTERDAALGPQPGVASVRDTLSHRERMARGASKAD
jgi:hypothetical protein